MVVRTIAIVGAGTMGTGIEPRTVLGGLADHPPAEPTQQGRGPI